MKLSDSPDGLAAPDRLAYTAGEVAQLLGVSKRHVEHLIFRGQIPSVKIGHSRRVRREALDQYLRDLEEDEAS